MTDTMTRPEVSAPGLHALDERRGGGRDDASGRITWASPGSGLWVASRTDSEGTTFLGFVEETLEEFVAVDGAGRSFGRFSALREAQAAFAAGSPSPALTTGPIRWVDAGARVVAPSSLRFG
ncbi:hypothetical protein L332_13435 [Agrococcus pavilionensis RW1]|uniref:Uncharacterized protein n=1 Tax=Agrococcus pavilionensis RW1 TaxID=1330458 RepID=U1LDY3_9MICO|nr:hypothetical protein [Agrococcus pavilionensis]ERG65438.1 hypothetical protein L332_13435 [Agrococcus pavilionensis RW1]